MHIKTLTLTLIVLLFVPQFTRAAKFVNTPGATLRLCYLYFGSIDDLGWTFTFNIGRLNAQKTLSAKYPHLKIESTYDSSVFFSIPANERRAFIENRINTTKCHAMIANSNTVYGPEFDDIAAAHPDVNFISINAYDIFNTKYPNRIFVTFDFFGAFHLAGIAAARQQPDCVGMIIAFETSRTSQDACNGMITGIRSVSSDIPIEVITMNSYFSPAAEEEAATLLMDRGCNVIGRYTDPRAVDLVVSKRNTDPSRQYFSLGPHSNLQQYVGDTVMLAAFTSWDVIIVEHIDGVVTTGSLSHVGVPYIYDTVSGAVRFTQVSPLAKSDAISAVSNKVASSSHDDLLGPYCTPQGVQLRNGSTITPHSGNTCLDEHQRNAVQHYFETVNATFHPIPFQGRSMCEAGTFAEYPSTGPISLTCTPCPLATYGDEEGMSSCKPCANGTFTDGKVGATQCIPIPEPESIATWIIVVIVVVAVVFVFATGFAVKKVLFNKTRHAPKEDNAKITIIFIAVSRSTEMWDKAPLSMPNMLSTYRKIVQKAASTHQCYEVKQLGEALMFATTDPANALGFTKDVMTHINRNDGNWRVAPVEKVQEMQSGGNSLMSSNHQTPSQTPKATPSNIELPPHFNDRGSVRSGRKGTRSRTRTRGGDDSEGSLSDVSGTVSPTRSRDNSTLRSKKSGRPTNITFSVNVGICHGRSRVIHNTASNSYDYRGPVVDLAAECADMAAAGQVLAAPTVVSAFSDPVATPYGAEFQQFCPILNKHGSLDESVAAQKNKKKVEILQLHQVNFSTLPKIVVAAPVIDETTGAAINTKDDSISTALEQRETGLANKRITVLAVRLKGMLRHAKVDKAGFVREYQSFLLSVNQAAKDNKGNICAQGSLGCELFINFNATINCASQVKRAVRVAMLVQHAASTHGWQAKIGLHTATTLVGTLGDNNVKVDVAASSIVDVASYLSGLCCQFDSVSCLTTATLKSELSTCAYTQTLEFARLPDMKQPVELVGVMSEREMEQTGEWMYELESAEQLDPFAKINDGFNLLKEGKLSQVDALVQEMRENVNPILEEGAMQLGKVLQRTRNRPTQTERNSREQQDEHDDVSGDAEEETTKLHGIPNSADGLWKVQCADTDAYVSSLYDMN